MLAGGTREPRTAENPSRTSLPPDTRTRWPCTMNPFPVGHLQPGADRKTLWQGRNLARARPG